MPRFFFFFKLDNFFFCIQQKPITTVRFFDRSDYYTAHGEDAELASKLAFKSTAVVKIMTGGSASKQELSYIVLSKNNFENVIRELLLVKSYRVEVFTKNSDTKEWNVEFRGSPGNLLQFEDILFSNNDMVAGSAIFGLQIKYEGQQKTVGIACIEANERIMSVMEFVDDDFFAELEAIVVLLSPKECLIPSIDGDVSFLRFYCNNIWFQIFKYNCLVLVCSSQNINGTKWCFDNNAKEI